MADDQHEQATPAAWKAAMRHLASAEKHERAVARHEEYARFLDEKGDAVAAEIERRNAMLERDAAQVELDRADALRGETQFTDAGLEIPIPTREDFLRNMDKVAPPVHGTGRD